MSGYRVVYVEPGKPAVEKEIGTKLEDLQEAVGGLIECIYAHNDGTLLVGNDEAKLLGMEGNRRLDSGSIIAGPFFVIGDAGKLPLPDRRGGQPVFASLCRTTPNLSAGSAGGHGLYLYVLLRGAP